MLGYSLVQAQLANHVEMKAVVVMIQNNRTEARVVINHAPCGSEPGLTGGCHSFLPRFIPNGRTLTVLGTDAKGNPFRRTYRGEAPR